MDGWDAMLQLKGEALLASIEYHATVYGADVCKGDKSSTALVEVATQGELEAVRKLVVLGADVNLPDSEGVTAVMAAASNGHLAVVRVLVDAQARVDLRCSPAVVSEYAAAANNVQKGIGLTALQWALGESKQPIDRMESAPVSDHHQRALEEIVALLRSTARVFQVGDDVECRDKYHNGKWCPARIMEARYTDANDERTASIFSVHFLGWKDKWDEWVEPADMRWPHGAKDSNKKRPASPPVASPSPIPTAAEVGRSGPRADF